MVKHSSLFLFGPRQTGKTTYLKETFPQARYFNLLDQTLFRRLSAHPEDLRLILKPSDRMVIVDEVQKLPVLLDEIQNLMDSRKELRFILTGSSARKLMRGRANLLGGRALMCRMHPLIFPEFQEHDLSRRLCYGSLPGIYLSEIPEELLDAYTGTYLREEIQAEGIARNIQSFSRFLEVAALTNGQVVNFTKVGSDAQVPPRTVQSYYEVLSDTLVGTLLPPFRAGYSRKAVTTPKFFFFDIGVANALQGRFQIAPFTTEYGQALEHLVFLELQAYLDIHRLKSKLSYWRTYTSLEVDFIVGRSVAIEVKATRRVKESDLTPLRALSADHDFKQRLMVSHDTMERVTTDGITLLTVESFLHQLWSQQLEIK
ncbi:MAG TPA: ATP-binding protein [Candidatus Obscuribacterales bacterium]